MGIITAILILSFLVLIHELGHFSAARFFGVHVEEFGLGLPIGIKKPWVCIPYKGTLYTIYPVFLGGFVKMKGQDDSDPSKINYDNDSYSIQAPWKRLIILFAGPFFNFISAFILYWIIAMNSPLALAPIVGEVQPNTPAYCAGLRGGEKILSINQHNITKWDDISPLIKQGGKVLEVRYEKNHRIIVSAIIPRNLPSQTIFGEKIMKPMIGIAPQGTVVHLDYTWHEAIGVAFDKTYDASHLIVQSVQKLIAGIIPLENMGGVVGIVDVTAKASEHGWMALAMLTALLSVNLGVLNLLPIPALDGGHMMFTFYEMITKRPPSQTILIRLTLFGWAILASLMILGLYNDIHRLLG